MDKTTESPRTETESPAAASALKEVRMAGAAGALVRCPMCGWTSNGRILRGNFKGWRNTSVGPTVRHIRSVHGEAV